MKRLTLLLLIATSVVAQDKGSINVGTGETITLSKPSNITWMAPNSVDSVIILCDEWKPVPRGCHILDGKTFDDLVGTMMETERRRNDEVTGAHKEADDLRVYQTAYWNCLDAAKAKKTVRRK